MNTLAERLKFARKKRQLTQIELSKKCGVSQQSISQIESGKAETTNEIFNLSDALEIEPKWLATGQGSIDLPRHSAENIKLINLLNNLTVEQKKEFIEMIEKQNEKNRQIINELSK